MYKGFFRKIVSGVSMIRLNTWQQAVEKDNGKDSHRLSDLIANLPSDLELQMPSTEWILKEPENQANLLNTLRRRQTVKDLQFWTDFQAYLCNKPVDRCLYIKCLASSIQLTDDIWKCRVQDEFEADATLYLSLRWLRQQSLLPDRPVQLALRHRPLDAPFAEGYILLLYDFIRTEGNIIVAEKFHL